MQRIWSLEEWGIIKACFHAGKLEADAIFCRFDDWELAEQCQMAWAAGKLKADSFNFIVLDQPADATQPVSVRLLL